MVNTPRASVIRITLVALAVALCTAPRTLAFHETNIRPYHRAPPAVARLQQRSPSPVVSLPRPQLQQRRDVLTMLDAARRRGVGSDDGTIPGISVTHALILLNVGAYCGQINSALQV